MKKYFLYSCILLLIISSCEEVYIPDLDNADDFLVVEGRLMANQHTNTVLLHNSLNFINSNQAYPPVAGAKVFLVTGTGEEYAFHESTPGAYQINHTLVENLEYHLQIELDGEVYKSEIQVVPEIPHIDSIYGEYGSNVYVDENNELATDYGVRLYADIMKKGNHNHYRFYARKIIQFVYLFDSMPPGESEPIPIPVYNWKSFYPTGIYNIAGPPDYSTSDDIYKHPLEFFDNDVYKIIADTQYFAGWIYIIDQFGLSEGTYNYYESLNSQLGSEGKIFDPVYVQAEGNVQCITSPEVKVMGNFEIVSYKEHRYFLNYYRHRKEFSLKKIPYFYGIPIRGRVLMSPPDFWETYGKIYPGGK